MIKSYLRSHFKVFLFLFIDSLIFFVLSYLYGWSMDSLIYALLLVISVSFLFVICDYHQYRQSVGYLIHLKNDFLVFPEHPRPLEKEYIDLYNTLYDQYKKAMNESMDKSLEMMDYYSMWVHQIKTPIAAMHLILQNQKNTDLSLENELFKIEQYVEMVLSYLRLDSDQTDYRFEHIEVDHVIREVIRKYSRLFIQKKLTLQFEPTHMQYLTDEKWLAFVLEQILSNAIKYTHQGGVRIYKNGNLLLIEDEGIGISAEDLPRIFEKGYTGYNGRIDKKSTGIGLYLAKEVTHRLGIGISVTSTPGIGTSVCLDLSPKHLEIE